MIGLGVGVDYALFIVTRFRQELRGFPGGSRPPGLAQRTELHEGQMPSDAMVTAMRTAGRAVLTAGTTVVIGMLGLLAQRRDAAERGRDRGRGHRGHDRDRLDSCCCPRCSASPAIAWPGRRG